jgi:hypothetical protein
LTRYLYILRYCVRFLLRVLSVSDLFPACVLSEVEILIHIEEDEAVVVLSFQNLNPGHDTREQATKRTTHTTQTRKHTHEGTHQRARPTNQATTDTLPATHTLSARARRLAGSAPARAPPTDSSARASARAAPLGPCLVLCTCCSRPISSSCKRVSPTNCDWR